MDTSRGNMSAKPICRMFATTSAFSSLHLTYSHIRISCIQILLQPYRVLSSRPARISTNVYPNQCRPTCPGPRPSLGMYSIYVDPTLAVGLANWRDEVNSGDIYHTLRGQAPRHEARTTMCVEDPSVIYNYVYNDRPRAVHSPLRRLQRRSGRPESNVQLVRRLYALSQGPPRARVWACVHAIPQRRRFFSARKQLEMRVN